MSRRRWLIAALALQVALVGWTALPRLLPRLTGTEYRILVEPVDPIDPFRGAYVDLAYPLLRESGGREEGRLWVPLRREGDAWVPAEILRRRPPGDQPVMRCEARDYRIRCGIESFFASQTEAKRLEGLVARGGAIARVRIDGAGRAAIVGLEPRSG